MKKPTASPLLLVAAALSLFDTNFSAAAITAAAIPAALQGSFSRSALSNLQANLEHVDKLVANTTKRHPELGLAVLPEALFWSFGMVQTSSNETLEQRRRRLLEYTQDGACLVNGSLPCSDTADDSASSQLQYLSCVARRHKLALVVNMAVAYNCSSSVQCKPDGDAIYNTDVAFNATGHVVSIYHKAHVFGTAPVLDQPPKPTPAIFWIGNRCFGLIICYDAEFPQPTRAILDSGCQTFVMSSSWINDAPWFSAVMFQQAWSRTHNATLIVANRGDSAYMAGSGIYHKGHVLAIRFSAGARGPDEVPAVAQLTERPDSNVLPSRALSQHDTQSGILLQPEPEHCHTASTNVTLLCAQASMEALPANIPLQVHLPSCRVTFQLSQPSTAVYVLASANDSMIYSNTPSTLRLDTCSFFACRLRSSAPMAKGTECSPAWPEVGDVATFDFVHLEEPKTWQSSQQVALGMASSGQGQPADETQIVFNTSPTNFVDGQVSRRATTTSPAKWEAISLYTLQPAEFD